jgi:DNA-binding MarR family transcriptional regulator
MDRTDLDTRGDEQRDADYRALAQFRYEIRNFIAFSERAAREEGLEPQQHQLLLLLRGLPEGMRPNVRTIAERLLLRPHSATELVARAVGQGLVERESSPDDGREVLLRLTPRGLELLEALTRIHREELDVLGPRLITALDRLMVRS